MSSFTQAPNSPASKLPEYVVTSDKNTLQFPVGILNSAIGEEENEAALENHWTIESDSDDEVLPFESIGPGPLYSEAAGISGLAKARSDVHQDHPRKRLRTLSVDSQRHFIGKQEGEGSPKRQKQFGPEVLEQIVLSTSAPEAQGQESDKPKQTPQAAGDTASTIPIYVPTVQNPAIVATQPQPENWPSAEEVRQRQWDRIKEYEEKMEQIRENRQDCLLSRLCCCDFWANCCCFCCRFDWTTN